jgi:4-carboxy-3-alkylbut-2-enoyl-[acp] decarboxylase
MSGDITSLAVDPSGVAVLAMEDSARKNALSTAMVRELEDRCDAIRGDDRIKAIVFRGLDDYFSTGADKNTLEEILAGRVTPRDLLLPRALLDIPVPVIAAMEGHALGGGLAIAVCADITIAARESRYGATFMQYGFTPGLGLTRLLEQVVGTALASEMLLTGRTFRGSHFERRGLFNYVLPKSEVMAKAHTLAVVVAEKPRTALVALKTTLSARKRAMFEAARAAESTMHALTFNTLETRQLIDELLT